MVLSELSVFSCQFPLIFMLCTTVLKQNLLFKDCRILCLQCRVFVYFGHICRDVCVCVIITVYIKQSMDVRMFVLFKFHKPLSWYITGVTLIGKCR